MHSASLRHSPLLKKKDRWAQANYEELFDNLSEGCTQSDVNKPEYELDISLF